MTESSKKAGYSVSLGEDNFDDVDDRVFRCVCGSDTPRLS